MIRRNLTAPPPSMRRPQPTRSAPEARGALVRVGFLFVLALAGCASTRAHDGALMGILGYVVGRALGEFGARMPARVAACAVLGLIAALLTACSGHDYSFASGFMSGLLVGAVLGACAVASGGGDA